METTAVQKSHKLVLNNRKTGLVTGVLDVLSFNLNEILLETEQGMLMVKGTDLHVNRVNLEKGEIDLSGNITVSRKTGGKSVWKIVSLKKRREIR